MIVYRIAKGFQRQEERINPPSSVMPEDIFSLTGTYLVPLKGDARVRRHNLSDPALPRSYDLWAKGLTPSLPKVLY
jgi:hypothetical protein